MNDLSDEYNLRKCYLQREQVPTQSMMKRKMGPALAAVYFNSMTPKLKILAGLEPALKGGGSDWYVPPEELLKGRSVLKPIEKKVMSKLNHKGIELIGTSVSEQHRQSLKIEKEQRLASSDMHWRGILSSPQNTMAAELAAIHSKKNTESIKNHFKQFTNLYRESLRKIEKIFHESAIVGIKKTQENAIASMQNKYTISLNHQAKLIYDVYEKKLEDEKSRLKAEFLKDVEKTKKDFAEIIHDNNIDKHKALTQLKQFFAFQNLACQVYVALKEREECLIAVKELQHKHQKHAKIQNEVLASKDFEIFLESQKQQKFQKFSDMWTVKIYYVVTQFKHFVSYCLNMLPEHAEFFINLEKLMLLQLNEVLENPTAESIITIKEEQFVSPVPQAIPFYMFCDRGFRAQVDQNLCPKHGGTSTTTQMPAIIINRRFLYANCDNFDLFSNKIKDYIHGNRGDDVDINDDIKYENLVPVTYTPSQQLKEIQLESSLLNVVKQEIVELTSDIPKDINVCDYCKHPLCFCTDLPDETATSKNKPDLSQKSKSSEKITATLKISSTSKIMQYHEREPKWDSYFTHVEPKACPCSKIAKKTLEHNFPVYMRQVNTSVYQPPYMPHYEMCSVDTLKALVKGARKNYSPDREIEPEEAQIETKKDMSTQYIEPEIEKLCTCFSDPEVEYLFNSNPFIDPNPKHVGASREIGCRLVGSDISPTFLNRRAQSFAMDRARSLRILLGEEPELQVLFKRN